MIIDTKNYGFKKISLEEIKGGNAKTNAQIIRGILAGDKGPKKDIVILNSAAALLVSGRVKNLEEGLLLANNSIEGGKAERLLERSLNIQNI